MGLAEPQRTGRPGLGGRHEGPDLRFLAEARRLRGEDDRRRRRAALAVSVVITVAWAVWVLAGGHGERVADRWVAALTMVFGSFVAGSTPQGGGAVAFPVFTKVLDTPSEVARTFSLCIQTVGMGAASAAIMLRRTPYERRTLLRVALPSAAGFGLGLALLGRPDVVFWPSRIPGPYVKVTFTVITVAMAAIVLLGMRVRIRQVRSRAPEVLRAVVALVAAGLAGGVASSLVGSGADLAIYLVLAVLFGVDPRVAIPTSVLTMAAVSAVGLVVLGLVDGQLAITLDAGGDVVQVGRRVLDEPLSGARFDLFGLWLAAVPVVAWGAPAGAWAAARMSARTLVVFAGVLAATEMLTTALCSSTTCAPTPGSLPTASRRSPRRSARWRSWPLAASSCSAWPGSTPRPR